MNGEITDLSTLSRADVAEVQRQLNAKGFHLKVDGRAGAKTAAALAQYRAHGGPPATEPELPPGHAGAGKPTTAAGAGAALSKHAAPTRPPITPEYATRLVNDAEATRTKPDYLPPRRHALTQLPFLSDSWTPQTRQVEVNKPLYSYNATMRSLKGQVGELDRAIKYAEAHPDAGINLNQLITARDPLCATARDLGRAAQEYARMAAAAGYADTVAATPPPA